MEGHGEVEHLSTVNPLVKFEGNVLIIENHEKEKRLPSSKLDFSVMAKEFNKIELWSERSGTNIRETFAINFLVGLLPTIFDVGMDSLAVNDYLRGTYYVKNGGESNCSGIYPEYPPKNYSETQTECFEKDPVFGYVTLFFLFFPGMGFSFWTFLNLSNFLRGTDYTFRQNACFFIFFTPLTLLVCISFPFQLLAVNLVALLNNGDQWTLLTTKYSIAEGLYDASLQFCVQLFIVFTMADRIPSIIQYLSLFGSIVMLAYTRIEAHLLDDGGHVMPIREKIIKTLKLIPIFLSNSIFKLGSIGLICSLLRLNAMTFYGAFALLWILFYFLFNQGCLSRRYYHLILGVMLHAVSIGKIPGQIKMVQANLGEKRHKTRAKKLTTRNQMENIIFQNILWLIINSIMLITLTILANVQPDVTLWTLFPFTPDSKYTLDSMPIHKYCHILTPVIISCGLLSLVLIICQWGCGDAKVDNGEDIVMEGEEEEDISGENAELDDPSVQAKVADKLEPVLNLIISASDNQLDN
eukprot:GFUD01011216.1.p1 GENE.GFUD01011216.1~~GFUD01011216.1.p1  ORF type:complete len:524 (+),score=119.10 GFUD01011216.1:163-1734(+)